MKRITLFILLVNSMITGRCQSWQLGVGVQTFSQPFSGMVAELEHAKLQNPSFATLSRIDLGYRIQTAQHQAATLELHRGFQYHLNKSLFVEQTFGLGIMYSFYQSAYWYKNDWYQLIYTGKNARTVDVIPSVTLGIVHPFGGEEHTLNSVWIRPKIFWQLPSNNPANPNFTAQIGFSRRLSN